MKIVAVDDEPYILELMPLLASRSGFPDVTTFSSGRLALDELMHGKAVFDCLLLDINMPEMDGIELCRRVRQLEAYRKTPIIMLTAMSERDFMDSAFKAGATDFATKPFHINELGARLRVAQELVAARREAQEVKASPLDAGSKISQTSSFDVSEAICLDGVKDLIDLASLRNYLKQSSRAGLAALQLIAIKVDQTAKIHARATGEEFTYALRMVADAISQVMQTRVGLMAYAGNGTFIVVSNSPAPLLSSQIEAEVQFLLDEMNSEYDSGAPLDIEISIGNPIQPNSGGITDAPGSIERAVARAESRASTKLDAPATVSIRHFGR